MSSSPFANALVNLKLLGLRFGAFFVDGTGIKDCAWSGCGFLWFLFWAVRFGELRSVMGSACGRLSGFSHSSTAQVRN